jgi:hypothetical protein
MVPDAEIPGGVMCQSRRRRGGVRDNILETLPDDMDDGSATVASNCY